MFLEKSSNLGLQKCSTEALGSGFFPYKFVNPCPGLKTVSLGYILPEVIHMKRILALLFVLTLIPAAYAKEGETMQNKTIYLAGGCFWGTEHLLSLVPGVIDAESGYANGTRDNPTYEEVCRGDTGHRETVRVRYAPSKVSLRDILKLYFSVVDPLTPNKQGNDVGTQYQAGIYYEDEESRAVVEEMIALEKNKHTGFTIEHGPKTSFWPAEDYHQDYLVKNPSGYCHIPLSAFERAKTVGQETQKAPLYRALSPEEAQKMKQQNHSAVFLDVRTPEEYKEGHLPDAVNLPLDEIEKEITARFPEKDTVLLIYCRSGRRSRAAAEALVAMGYTEVYDFGGINSWPYDIVR